MCGICGVLNLEYPEVIAEGTLRQMIATQQHRGPDDEGYMCEARVGLGFCRLAILDLTPAGHQPMSNEDGTLWLVFNGEIYNYRQMVPELELAGHCIRSRTDSEVILHAYEQWGTSCLEHFNGMFAFVLWDSRRRRIFIARDRLGVKPLYYWSDGKHFAFASELKALLAYPAVQRQLNPQALQSYLAYEYIAAPESIFRHIRKLPAGHFLDIALDGSSGGTRTEEWLPERYWDLQFSSISGSARSVEDYTQELESLLQAAVKHRLISDVPLGVFLSGGLDSSSVVAMMAEASSKQLKTFSIGFTEKSFNELDYARRVAEHFNTEHHEEIMRPNVHELVHSIARMLDEPFADASILPTYLVSQLARKHVTVALAGDGGDELFAGYDTYRAQRFASQTIDRLPDSTRAWLSQLAAHIPPTDKKKGLLNTTRRFLMGASLAPALQHTRWHLFWRDEELEQLLTLPAEQRIPAPDPRLLVHFASSGSLHPLDQQQYTDIKRYLPDDILFKVDRMSMANSLEARAPFLDYTLVEFAARLPLSIRMHKLGSKYLLRQVVKHKLPYATLHRPKLGFNIPYKLWLQHELRDLLQDTLTPKKLKEQGLFSPSYVQTLIDEHLSGTRDHAHKLWQLLIFQLWSDAYLHKASRPMLVGGKTARFL